MGKNRKMVDRTVADVFKVEKFVKEIMERMQENSFNKEEAEFTAYLLKKQVKQNSERIEKSKPFTIYNIIQ